MLRKMLDGVGFVIRTESYKVGTLYEGFGAKF